VTVCKFPKKNHSWPLFTEMPIFFFFFWDLQTVAVAYSRQSRKSRIFFGNKIPRLKLSEYQDLLFSINKLTCALERILNSWHDFYESEKWTWMPLKIFVVLYSCYIRSFTKRNEAWAFRNVKYIYILIFSEDVSRL
jgi:hypothetical protein